MERVLKYLSNKIEVTRDELGYILQHIHYQKYSKHDIIVKQGDINNRMAFINKGAIRRYYVDSNGHEKTVSFLFEDHPLVDYDFFFNPVPATLTIEAIEDLEIVWGTREAFFGFLEKFPRYEPFIRMVMSEYMFLEVNNSRILRIDSAKEKYEALLKYQPEVVKRVPLKYIASYLDMAIETLSRVRAGKL